MPHPHRGSFREQLSSLRRPFLPDAALPFSKVLWEELVAQALTAISAWLDRSFSPLVTLWAFLGQVSRADHSCRAAVARLIAHRLARGQSPCSAETGAYGQARKRLPETFFADVARQTGRTPGATVDPQGLWKRRRGYAFDGSSVSRPDTPANRHEYPQPDTQERGLGFPLARLAAVSSRACGAVLDRGICRSAGKGPSASGLLRTAWGISRPGDVLLADRLTGAWTERVMLKGRGVDPVTRLSKRRADSRRGERLGQGDHLARWLKPTKPRSLDRETYDALPGSLMIRGVRVRVEQPGFRVPAVIGATTSLGAEELTESAGGQLYRARWDAELDRRSRKRTMQMDALRRKTPELVRKGSWTHVLADNLIRTIAAQAATERGIDPRSIRCKGALQTLEAFQPVSALRGEQDPAFRSHLYRQLLDAIASHRVADRPDRYEPRLRKRRPKHYGVLRKPRLETERDMLNGFSEN